MQRVSCPYTICFEKHHICQHPPRTKTTPPISPTEPAARPPVDVRVLSCAAYTMWYRSRTGVHGLPVGHDPAAHLAALVLSLLSHALLRRSRQPGECRLRFVIAQCPVPCTCTYLYAFTCSYFYMLSYINWMSIYFTFVVCILLYSPCRNVKLLSVLLKYLWFPV